MRHEQEKEKRPGQEVSGHFKNSPDATSDTAKVTKDINDLFLRQDGLEVRGGCDSCDAIQKLSTISGSVSRLTIVHDSWCPEL
jgi:hypothetical protein